MIRKCNLLAAAAVLLGASVSAQAADLPARAYKAPPVAVSYNWTGFYLGVMGGYAFGSGDFSNASGGVAGGTIGYNWQAPGSSFVFGLEGDLGWTNFGDSVSATAGGATATIASEAHAVATFRARLGAAFDRTLVYVTGGGAWARNEVSASVAIPSIGVAAGVSDSQNHFGYVVGAGIEHAFTPTWSGKIEYNYLGLGSETYFQSFGGLSSGDVNIHFIKAGLNYRFGG
jgi:outer membrane immunogenic protein